MTSNNGEQFEKCWKPFLLIFTANPLPFYHRTFIFQHNWDLSRLLQNISTVGSDPYGEVSCATDGVVARKTSNSSFDTATGAALRTESKLEVFYFN